MMNVCYGIDINVVKYAAVSICSLFYNNTESDISVYVLCFARELSAEAKEQLRNLPSAVNAEAKHSVTIIEVERSQFDGFIELWGRGRVTKAMFLRYKIPALLANSDKALYVDVDTVVIGKLDDLYNTDLTDYYLGGVQEFKAVKQRNINSGVLLINAKLWREDGIEQKLFDITIKNRLCDQIAINIICKDKIKYLEDKYNYQYNNFHYNTPVANPEYYRLPPPNHKLLLFIMLGSKSHGLQSRDCQIQIYGGNISRCHHGERNTIR